MKALLLPYKPGSKSAKVLVEALRPLAKLKKQATRMPRRKVLINWGNSHPLFNTAGVKVLNKPEAVAKASDKLTALEVMKAAGVRVPDFTSDINIAKEWLEGERMVFCRKLLRANSGQGIVIAKVIADLVHAPLYTKYIRKEKEYRLHVFNGTVIDMVEKRRRSGFEQNAQYSRYIRSYEQGWIMAREGINVSSETKLEAIKAVQALGLDFGAVDIVINRDGLPVILEVNTAPGIQGTTLNSYKKAIKEYLDAAI